MTSASGPLWEAGCGLGARRKAWTTGWTSMARGREGNKSRRQRTPPFSRGSGVRTSSWMAREKENEWMRVRSSGKASRRLPQATPRRLQSPVTGKHSKRCNLRSIQSHGAQPLPEGDDSPGTGDLQRPRSLFASHRSDPPTLTPPPSRTLLLPLLTLTSQVPALAAVIPSSFLSWPAPCCHQMQPITRHSSQRHRA